MSLKADPLRPLPSNPNLTGGDTPFGFRTVYRDQDWALQGAGGEEIHRFRGKKIMNAGDMVGKSIQPTMTVRGFRIFKGFLDGEAQTQIVSDVRDVAGVAPFFFPVTASGRKMSVRMTSAGRVGWTTDQKGYRYERAHPSGVAWPDIPDSILAIWRAVSDVSRDPDTCLINFYDGDARMGLHQDRDEGDFSFPVVSISLGDEALFRMGGTSRSDKTESLWLSSGDIVVFGDEARLAYHGVDRIKPGTSRLLPKSGRINLTLRVVTV